MAAVNEAYTITDEGVNGNYTTSFTNEKKDEIVESDESITSSEIPEPYAGCT